MKIRLIQSMIPQMKTNGLGFESQKKRGPEIDLFLAINL